MFDLKTSKWETDHYNITRTYVLSSCMNGLALIKIKLVLYSAENKDGFRDKDL